MEERKKYDTNVTLWSPSGRLYQVEYAMEAVKQGALSIGVRSDSHIVLASFNKPASKLLPPLKKIFRIDDHVAVAMCGLAADARAVVRFLQAECVNHRFDTESALPVGRLVAQLADKAQFRTQHSWKRPYGVGLLVAGLDEIGPHLYYICPSGNYFEYLGFAIGSRSTPANTLLERKYEGGDSGFSGQNIVKVALSAMKKALPGEEFTSSICTVAVLGVDVPFQIVNENLIQEWINELNMEEEAAKAEAYLHFGEEVGSSDVHYTNID